MGTFQAAQAVEVQDQVGGEPGVEAAVDYDGLDGGAEDGYKANDGLVAGQGAVRG